MREVAQVLQQVSRQSWLLEVRWSLDYHICPLRGSCKQRSELWTLAQMRELSCINFFMFFSVRRSASVTWEVVAQG